jgi:DNA polymerase
MRSSVSPHSLRNGSCKACELHKTCKFVCVPGDGASDADLVLVGEAPGATEDSLGLPFRGEAGHLLDKILARLGIYSTRSSAT